MKLLFDNNLSYRRVSQLEDLYPDSTHVALIGLDTAADQVVWEAARQGEYCLVSKDADFNDLLAKQGFPPKVIWLRLGNCTTAEVALVLREHHQAIIAFGASPDAGLLELYQS